MKLCSHIKTDGRRCGSPALRESQFCYFHHNYGKPRSLPRSKKQRGPAVELPVLEDANSVQVALMQIMGGLIEGSIDDRKAGLLLWALQIASANSKRVKFEDHNAVIRSFLYQAKLTELSPAGITHPEVELVEETLEEPTAKQPEEPSEDEMPLVPHLSPILA
jgi:hypothetical protein